MKRFQFVAAAAAVIALSACSKSNDSGSAGSSGAATDTINVVQASPPAGGTWADVVNPTSSHAFVMGNPNAKVKLIEIGALSCPHCKLFEDEGAPALINNYVKTGQVSWEFRPYVIHGPVDMAANLIARCNGIKSFFPMVQAFYKDQANWLGKLEAAPQDKVNAIQNLPTNQVFVAMANLMGLQDWAAARGLSQAKANQCLSNQQMIDQEVQVTSDVNSQFSDFTGTPAFVINGKMLPQVASWDKLEPALKDALK